MKLTRIITLVLAGVLTAANLSGCETPVQSPDTTLNPNGNTAATPPTDMPRNPTPLSLVAVNAAPLLETDYAAQHTTARTAATGANDFAFRLSAALAGQAGQENFVCSPYSVWLPLAALLNATDEPYKVDLLSALSASGLSEDDVNRAASRMLYDLTKQQQRAWAEESGEHYQDPLKIANAIFVNHDLTLKQSFAQTFMDFYRGSVFNVDFLSGEAVDSVNNWASEQTEGLITDIIQEFDPETVAAIANALYFSAGWAKEFDPEETRDDFFRALSGDVNASFMLREGDGQTYYEDDRVQAMPLWFGTGGGLYILLPKDGDAPGLLSSMTHVYFQSIQNHTEQKTGKLLLPRFSVESGIIPLKDTLMSLGVPLFERASAPLRNLFDDAPPAFLSDAVQKAVIKVDEKGTTAAAVSVMGIEMTSLPMATEPFEMICDRPFVFVLYDNTCDGGSQVLFTGIVNQP